MTSTQNCPTSAVASADMKVTPVAGQLDLPLLPVGPPEGKWEERALAMAYAVRRWSSCVRDQVGAVVMTPDHDEFILGFNDTPRGTRNCGDGGCPRSVRPAPSGSPQLDDELCLHAEHNSVQRAGLRARGAVLAVSRTPCAPCTRAALAAGIVKIVVMGQ